jgi:PAS domain S-box-containing protein
MDKTTVLIVEDEAIVAADLAGKLRMLGYEVVGTAAEAEEAIELACSLEPSVVLMDIWLKGPMDGIETAEAIRRRLDVPVIYLTAHSDSATLERAKLSGPFGYILKPFEERELSTTIEMALYKHQSDLQLREQRETLRRANEELEKRVEERARELVAANEAAGVERKRLYDVLETLPVYVVLLDSDYHVPFANRFFRERFGESEGRRCYEYLFNRTEPCEICDTYSILKTKAPHHWYWTGPDGRDYDIYDYPFVDSDGSTMILEMGIDITEQKQAQKALTELNDTLEEQVIERTAQLNSATEKLRASRRAALNLMEDALIARRKAEEISDNLRLEIAERERAEEALRQSEERVRLKLESILTPEGDIGNLALDDVMDVRAIQALMDDFYRLTHIPMALIDLKGKVLVGVGWQEICTRYHRQHPETFDHCIESDTLLTAGIPEGEFRLYKCMNNMWDAATPLMVGGKHLGHLFTGQFFFDDELPDYEAFRSTAARYGFPEADYMAALDAVPRVSRESIDTAMAYFMKFAAMVSRLSYGNIKLARTLTERESLMQSLKESELFYSQTLESIPGMVFTTRPDGYCDFQSRQWVEFTGVPMVEHLGDGWNRLLHPDDRPRAYEAWRAAVEGRATYDLEYRVKRRDGEYEWFKVIGRPIRDAAGEIVKWFGVAVNIDANKKAEEDLRCAREAAEAASLAKSLFLANMSHELRTPLTGVLGMLEMAQSGSLDEKQREAIETAHMSGRLLLMIINDILDLTRLESGKLVFEEHPFSLHDLVTGSVDVFTPQVRHKGLDLVRRVSDDVPANVVGDRVRLQQVLTNLVGNAVKFTESGKVVLEISAGEKTAEGKREITFTVTDTGIGIAHDKMEMIFDSFCQADVSHTRQYGGTGLGLAISREIVERMGGTITCESTLGKGSSFSFTIPFLEADPDSVSKPEPLTVPYVEPGVQPVADEGRARLLVAEDDEVTRKVLGFMLQRSGFDFDFAGDGRQAVEMWEQGGYDLVVMDGQMPGMDGFAATAAIRRREQERGGHIPIVAMTAHALREDKERCLGAGMDAYLSKPIDFKKCMEVIRGLLGQGERE